MSYFTKISSFVYFCFVLACVCAINIDFDDSRDGFFLKSPYHKFKASEPTIVKEALILTHPAEVYKQRASYGPFEMYQVVPNEILNEVHKYEETFDKSETHMHRHIIHNMDVSAHLVSNTVSQSKPYVQVLVHAHSLTRRHKQDLIYSYYGYTQRSCAQIFVTKGTEQYSSVCVLNGDTNACVASVHVPDYWWNTSNTSLGLGSDTQVFYHLTRVEQNQECASVSNTIVPARVDLLQGAVERKFISLVHLVHEPVVYDDHVDKDLVFRVPRLDLLPGSKFEVPILLEKNSALKQFVMKVRVRGGLELEGAVSVPRSSWRIVYQEGDRDGVATVTAFLKEQVKYTKSFKKEEVMRWKFKVSSRPDLPAMARVAWTVDYQQNGLSRNSYFSPEDTKVTVKFNLHSGQAEQIVPVLKERSLLNTAILTGKPVTNEVIIYAVYNNNSFQDITKESSCRSIDPDALKISSTCDHIYLDGSESRGSKNVTVLIRTLGHLAQLGVRVWVPEPKLDIQLSDPKLSQIRGWKVDRDMPAKSRSKRSVDLGLLTLLGERDKAASQQYRWRNKYQQSLVDVYARFMIKPAGGAPVYYRNKKTYVRVTGLVKDHLSVLNHNIAKMVGATVQGVSPGRTEVQVISPTGKLLGAKEIKVAKGKVEMERLMVRVISGMGLHISQDRHLPGALMATVHLRDQLVARQQEAVLDIAVEFKDGTMLPLSEIDPSEYDLKVVSLNPNVVEISEAITSGPSLPPSIKAMGNGKGEIIKVILRENGLNPKRKYRTLDTEHVHVMVDFAKDNELPNLVQSDGYYMNSWASREEYRSLYNNKGDYFKQHSKKYQHYPLDSDSKEPKAEPPKIYLNGKDFKVPDTFTQPNKEGSVTEEIDQEAVEQPIKVPSKHMSPLEIGMYVLVAVFIFAILVFTANCAVFMVRYQRKRSSKASARVQTASVSQAPDWVWIGRATLERHGAGNAGCNHALMAEEDFNGNQMVVPNSLPSSRSSNRRQKKTQPPQNGRDGHLPSSTSGVTGSSDGSSSSGSNRNSIISTYKGSECSVRITSNPLPDEDSGMGYNEAEWDYEAMGMTYEQLMDYFDNLKESSA